MPGLGWNCKCGITIEEGKDFKWEFKCANWGCDEKAGKHSDKCSENDWQGKQAILKPLVDKHVETCSQAVRCKECQKAFKYLETATSVKVGTEENWYHKICWEEEQERERERFWDTPIN